MTADPDPVSPLVVVFLRGGADGLSMLRPLDDDRVESLRSGLVVPAADTVPAGEGFGLHPAMVATARRLGEGSVALVPAAGLPDTTRSHFSAQFAVEQCSGSDVEARGGWLGRHLHHTADDNVAPFRAVSLGQPQVPMLLSGSADVLAATSLADLSLDRTGARGPDPVDPSILGALWEGDQGALGPSAMAGLRALDLVADLRGVGDATAGAGAAKELVAVFGAGLGTEIGMLNLGGWDHHSDLGVRDGTFASLAAELDGTLDVLLSGIRGVTLVVVSEFGRRVAANDSGGSDHGRGGLVMVLGERVRGGVHGDWPGLIDLDDGDVRIANDVRSVFAEVAASVLGADVDAVLPGAPSTRLGVMV